MMNWNNTDTSIININNKINIRTVTFIIGLFILLLVSSSSNAAQYPVAGTSPWQRPASAPVIEWVKHNRVWYKESLTGINTPYPRSLYFLDNQGNWYTPFTRPGMQSPYDLRRWHHTSQ